MRRAKFAVRVGLPAGELEPPSLGAQEALYRSRVHNCERLARRLRSCCPRGRLKRPKDSDTNRIDFLAKLGNMVEHFLRRGNCRRHLRRLRKWRQVNRRSDLNIRRGMRLRFRGLKQHEKREGQAVNSDQVCIKKV